MLESIKRIAGKYFTSVLLWGYGWKSRECSHYDEYYSQWRDPFSGMWYRRPTAMKLLKTQVMDEYERR